ncbi:MAG TPA: FG-GAP-like repeat-containing protein [Candidatus Didemnitutus sp.]|nr:FG-GAP-like repeat-containing protein [Candidatus Didemnitutus sp.]
MVLFRLFCRLAGRSCRFLPKSILASALFLGAAELSAADYLFRMYADAIGGVPLFDNPRSVAIGSDGNLYVADGGNNVIRKVTPAGVVTTLAGVAGEYASQDGTGAAARFNGTYRIGADANGNLYVWDVSYTVGSKVAMGIRKVTMTGEVTTLLRPQAYWGENSNHEWWDPESFAVDAAGNCYIHDANHGSFCKVLPTGEVIVLATQFSANISSAGPMAVDGQGNLFAVVGLASIIKITPSGQISTVLGASQGVAYNGPNGPFQVGAFAGLCVDASGNLFATDSQHSGVYKITPGGSLSLVAGGYLHGAVVDGNGAQAGFGLTQGLTIDTTGNLFVGDQSTIRKIQLDGTVSTIAGCSPQQGARDGVGTTIAFAQPAGMAVDGTGNVFVADRGNHVVRKILPGGIVTTFAGRIGVAGEQDGPGASATLNTPADLALDAAGNLYVTEYSSVRKITPDGTVTTLAGVPGQVGYSDGTGAAARFNGLGGMVVDGSGNLIIADGNNSMLRQITSAGVVTTLFGAAGLRGTGDGVGSAAQIWLPGSIAADGSGSYFFIDGGAIRKFTPGGAVTTLFAASGGTQVVDGNATTARFMSPCDLAVAPDGALLVSESEGVIRRIDAAGNVTTVAGMFPGRAGASDDGSGSAARFSSIASIALDAQYNLIVVNSGGRVVVRGQPQQGEIPAVAQSTLDVYTKLGGSAVFSVNATSSLSLSYQWQVRPWGSPSWGDLTDGGEYAGTQSATLQVLAASLQDDASEYRCVVTNGQNQNVSSGQNLYVDVIAYSLQPADRVVAAGFATHIDVDVSALRTCYGYWQRSTNGGTTWVDVSTDSQFSNVATTSLQIQKATSALNGNRFRFVAEDGLADPLASTPVTLTVVPGEPNTFASVSLVGQTKTDTTWLWAGFSPRSIVCDHEGNLFVCMANRQVILKIVPVSGVENILASQADVPVMPGAVVTVFAGLDGTAGYADGSGTDARFNQPGPMAIDSHDNLFVAAPLDQTIRKITPDGTVSTYAGIRGVSVYQDGPAGSATFGTVGALAVGVDGTLFVVDATAKCIRKVAPDRSISTLTGGPGRFAGFDGPPSVARFIGPIALAVDSSNTLYVSDGTLVRKVAPDGTVSSLAGSGSQEDYTDGQGENARFGNVAGLAVDRSGDVVVADSSAGLIRKVAPDGTVTTIGGVANQYNVTYYGAFQGYYGDGVGGSARFCGPISLATGAGGEIYVADGGDAAIRVGVSGGMAPALTDSPTGRSVARNGSVTLSATASGNPAPVFQWFHNGVAIAGATGSSLSISHAQASDGGSYAVEASSLLGDTASAPVTLTVGGTPADFNGDGSSDLLWENSAGIDRALWYMNGTSIASFDYLAGIDAAWKIVGTGDFDGDGQTDIAWENVATGDRTCWFMNGKTITNFGYFALVDPVWHIAAIGDFDGDGKPDLVWENNATGDRAVWFLDGVTIKSFGYIAGIDPVWHIVGAADFDGDGQTDLVWENRTTGDRTIWYMNGAALSTFGYIGSVPGAWRIAMVSDMDGDGHPDLVWENSNTGDRAIWLLNDATLISSPYLAYVDPAWRIAP